MSSATPTSSLFSHAVVALIAAGMGWMICDIARQDPDSVQTAGGGDMTDSPALAGPGDEALPSGAVRSGIRHLPPKEKPPAPDQFSLRHDGSVVLPPGLRHRFETKLYGLDGEEEREELALLGFTKEEGDALFALAERVKQEARANERARAIPISKSETQTLLKIPPLAVDHEAASAQLRLKFEAIAGSKLTLMESDLEYIINKLSGEHRRFTVIACKRQGEDGKVEYDLYRFDPGTEGEILPQISQEELKSRASGHFSLTTYGPDEDHEYLFE